eukprot:CAMPEP_0118877900 /NCGR_PEP_ID=MMETSP1163-20130328/18028_1 /TAXON_ID=124430 /ORGANISM="Phaeomonas parva, Strain CCMP2877" /LENGTH=66 /DNA_ID=CAMNT_0006813671 /DNA_START=202 /DNA_END=399 /DNA_ORIENTATION=-
MASGSQECAFGRLKQKFLILKRGILCEHAKDVTNAMRCCMAVYNAMLEETLQNNGTYDTAASRLND